MKVRNLISGHWEILVTNLLHVGLKVVLRLNRMCIMLHITCEIKSGLSLDRIRITVLHISVGHTNTACLF